MIHAATEYCAEEQIVDNGCQLIPLAGAVDLDPGILLGTSSSLLLRVLLKTFQTYAPATPSRAHDSGLLSPGPVSFHSIGADQPSQSQCLDQFVPHLREDTAPTRKEFVASSSPPVDHPFSSALFERLSTN